MKHITLIALALLLSLPAQAGKTFMPLKPADHTLIHGKKFMSLGGGHDPIKLARSKQTFHSFRRQLAPLPPKTDIPSPTLEKTEKKEATSPKEDQTPTPIQEELQTTNREMQHYWPVDENVTSRISSPFGYRTHPVTGKYAFHEGIDIAAPKGTTVIASEQGEVTDTGHHQNLGNYVKISHKDGTYSLYGHLSKVIASLGTNVRRGQKIGEVGSTGRSTGPHLDYSLRRDGKPVNPIKHLKRHLSKNIALKKGI